MPIGDIPLRIYNSLEMENQQIKNSIKKSVIELYSTTSYLDKALMMNHSTKKDLSLLETEIRKGINMSYIFLSGIQVSIMLTTWVEYSTTKIDWGLPLHTENIWLSRHFLEKGWYS